MTNNKLIGIVASYYLTDKLESKLKLNQAYIEYFKKFGDVVVLDPTVDRVFPVDMLVLPGGADVLPTRYGQAPHRYTQKPDIYYEYFDTVVLPKYVSQGIPITGICRGFQTLNVFFGGQLSQDIAQEYSTKSRDEKVDILEFNDDVCIKHFGENNFKKATVKVSLKDKNKVLPYKVNSLHHQGVYLEQVSKEFEVLAINQLYGNVEAIIHKNLPIVAYQHHPMVLWGA